MEPRGVGCAEGGGEACFYTSRHGSFGEYRNHIGL